ncbi:hypothetical protein HPB52_014329 [Rhipicephalus sanguineus]|uniref:Uncharacterized protein n=1 Tax=Rhipicephalus sanguineus TaxID=34632 RepID=A0A9D4PXM0_RHISA|nr:hypothetical protein HPB52_014329 [Rhipicephalus sanguineus]
MEVAMKRRYATMMAAVLETEDDDAYFVSRKRSCWVKGWMQEKSLGIQHQLYDCLLKQDPDEYRRLLRMPHDVFERVLASVRPHIEKGDTNMRLAVSARTRLQLTLRYLASGDGSIWQTTPLQRAIARKKAGLPAFIDVPGQANLLLPPAIVGDDAFPLSPNLMKPFGGTQLSSAQKIFNYR